MKNIVAGILAHVDSGKTTLSEAMLYLSGAIRKLGLKVEKVQEFPIDGTAHTVILLRKIAHTPPQFPRRYAKIKQEPL